MRDEERPATPPARRDEPSEPPKLDPDAPPAKANADAPVPEDEPLKDQGDELDEPPLRQH
jgi:hypothetical protein